jgi:peptidoglycan hydrolase-like protein with peptidoglycan-binding domain
VFIAVPPDKMSPRATASMADASPTGMVAVALPSASLPPTASASSSSAPSPTPPVAAQVGPTTPSEPAPDTPASDRRVPIKPAPFEAASVSPVPDAELPPLRSDEVAEVQTRLHSFGFNPGPLDGAAGPMTQAAVMRYQQDRGQSPTATVDRKLLEQLRQDPAPPVAAPQVAQRAARPVRASSAARQSDPFEPLRMAARDVERWFQSLGR